MNTIEINEENLIHTIKDIRGLVWNHILPKLIDLEQEVELLRKIVWPYVQAQMDKEGNLKMGKTNAMMFSHMHKDDIEELLWLKARHTGAHASEVDSEFKHILSMISSQQVADMRDSSHQG